VSDQKTCPACILKAGIHRVGQWPGTLTTVDKTCTGRPGCVRDVGPRGMVGRIVAEHERLTTPERENPAPESAPAGADVPDGKDDLVMALRLLAGAQVRADSRERLRAAADEIARLRAEVETKDALLKADEAVIADLRAEVEKVGNEAMDHLDTLGDIHQEMDEYGLPMGGEVTATDVGRFVGHIRAEFPALAQRVAEKVREAMRMRASGVVLHSVSRHPLTAQREMRAEIVEEMAAMDLRPIVAAAIKEGE